MSKPQNLAILASILIVSAVSTSAQWAQNPHTGSSLQIVADRTNYAGMSGLAPELEVEVKDAHENAHNKQVVVEARVWGIDLVEPGSSQQPSLTRGYLLYRVDEQPVIKSAEKEMTFRNLSPGRHTVTVQLSSPDNYPVGTSKVMTVRIPN